MARKRSPENDWICQRCGCACDAQGERHLGGGQGMRACRFPPDPVLRRDAEAEAAALVAALRKRQ
jgi:hypothetical protein